ncbi:hypothetical protein [Streptomyces fagopyri]|uniref:hypothetical protein n=1 Tax=Streptomyces fagopyri TaxID=2662397 RepID=UPI0033F13CE1
MLVGGADDVAFEDLLGAWEAASPGSTELVGNMRAVHRDAAPAGVDLFSQYPLATHGAKIRGRRQPLEASCRLWGTALLISAACHHRRGKGTTAPGVVNLPHSREECC